MTPVAQATYENGAGPKARPACVRVRRDCSERVDVGHAKDPRVNLGLADVHAVEFHVAFDVDPAHIRAQRAFVRDLVVKAGMEREAPAVVEVKAVAGERANGLVLGKGCVVDARADERRDLRLIGEVILQREGRRQVLDLANLGAAGVDVMGEGPCGQKLDPEVVGDEVFAGERQRVTVVDVDGRRTGENAVAAFGDDAGKADPESYVAALLREGRAPPATRAASARAVRCFMVFPLLSCLSGR